MARGMITTANIGVAQTIEKSEASTDMNVAVSWPMLEGSVTSIMSTS